jgi:hypothetical protein
MSFALRTLGGEKADVPRKIIITDPLVKRARAMAYYRARLDQLTDAEIGKLWGRSRQSINAAINGLSSDARMKVEQEVSEARRAKQALRYLEASHVG